MASESTLLGAEASELVLRLPALMPQLQTLTFLRITPREGAARRLNLQLDTPLEDQPAMALLASRPPGALIDGLLRHMPIQPHDLIRVPASELSRSRLDAMILQLAANDALALCSSPDPQLAGGWQIPMMDFRVAPGAHALALLCEALPRLGLRRGALLESGLSYHLYGFDPMTPSEWWEFKARCLLLAPLTDVRYIAHQLLDGSSALRFTATPLKPRVPLVVHSFGV